jgi:hypothetical protein
MKNSSFNNRIGLRTILISAISLFLVCFCSAQKLTTESLYMDQVPPGTAPKGFPLAVKQGFFAAERIAISPDGRDIYYSEIKAYYPIRGENIKKYSYSDGKWTGPFNLFDGYAPGLSITGDTMYLERKDAANNSQTYISIRNGQSWGNPKRILTGLDKAHYYQFTRSGNYYISTKSGNGEGLSDWCKVIINVADTTATSLGKPLNTAWDNLDFFVARDETYIIITTPLGLAISFNKKDGTWSNPISLGKKINFGLGMWGQWVTDDNKYLFYSTGTKPDYSDVSVYWVRIDGIIDSLR